MSPNDAALALLKSLALPYGTISILPWPENGRMVMHVMIERAYLRSAMVPSTFAGYDVTLEERQPALAHS